MFKVESMFFFAFVCHLKGKVILKLESEAWCNDVKGERDFPQGKDFVGGE